MLRWSYVNLGLLAVASFLAFELSELIHTARGGGTGTAALVAYATLLPVFAWAGYLARGVAQILLAGAAIIVPSVLVSAYVGLTSPRPLDAPIWVTDSVFWVSVGLQYVVFAMIIGAISLLFGWTLRSSDTD